MGLADLLVSASHSHSLGYRCTLLGVAFTWTLGIELMASCLHDK